MTLRPLLCGAQDEVQELVRDVYGSKYSENQHLHQVIKRLDRDGDGKVSYSAFCNPGPHRCLAAPSPQAGSDSRHPPLRAPSRVRGILPEVPRHPVSRLHGAADSAATDIRCG